MGRFERALARARTEREHARAPAPIVVREFVGGADLVALEHAAPPGAAETPIPRELDEYGQAQNGLNDLYAVRAPDPDHIELLYLISHEFATCVKTVRGIVFQEPLAIKPKFGLKCLDPSCGHETDRTQVEKCPSCFGPADRMRKPDESQKRILDRIQKDLNDEGETLENFGCDIEDYGNKHDRAFIVYRFRHELNPDGTLRASYFEELRAGDPRIMRVVKKDGQRMGGQYFICIRCRGTPDYVAEEERRACQSCGGVTYDAHFVEVQQTHAGQTVTAYYLPMEVRYEDSWHYRGSAPVARLWDKLIALVWMDKYVVMGFDPRRGRRPDKAVAYIGGDKNSIKAWWKEDAANRARNPYHLATIYVPHNGPTPESRPDVKVLDFGNTELLLQSPEIRAGFKQDARTEFGLMPLSGGSTEASGGLNNEGLQLRVESRVVRAHQRIHQRWLDRLCEANGVTDYGYAFQDTLIEEESLDAETVLKHLDVAERAARNGLNVRWVDNRPIIEDGEIKAAAPTMPGMGGVPGIPGTGPGPFEGKPPSMDATVEMALVAHDPIPRNVLEQAPLSDANIPSSVDVAFKGPSGALLARDVLYADLFAGITQDGSDAVKREIVDSMSQPQGWSERSIAKRILPILEREGLQDASERASLIARMEPAAMASEVWLRQAYTREGETRTPFLYEMVGPNDHRTTKLSRWIRAQTNGGVTLDRLLNIIDHGIELAKSGAFTPNGMYSGIVGEPIRLPGYFYRRGTIAHFGERDVPRRLYARGAA